MMKRNSAVDGSSAAGGFLTCLAYSSLNLENSKHILPIRDFKRNGLDLVLPLHILIC